MYDKYSGCRCCDAVEAVENPVEREKESLFGMYEVKHKKITAKSYYGYYLVKMYEMLMLIFWDEEFLLNVSYLELTDERLWVVFGMQFFIPPLTFILLPIWGMISLIMSLITLIHV